MKLYTEEQVIHAVKMARSSSNIFTTPFLYDKDEILEYLTPIELPSYEEIETKIENMEGISLEIEVGYRAGARWMLNKILNK